MSRMPISNRVCVELFRIERFLPKRPYGGSIHRGVTSWVEVIDRMAVERCLVRGGTGGR